VNRVSGALITVCCGVLVSSLATLRAQRATTQFRTGVHLVVVPVSVTDASGHFASGLARDDFLISDNNVPQSIAQFAADRVPVSLGIVLDISESMKGRRLEDTRGALERFLGLLGEEDDVFLYVFNDTLKLLVPSTRDRTAIARALATIVPAGNTGLFRGVYTALPFLNQGPHRKKAMIIVSDGNDRELLRPGPGLKPFVWLLDPMPSA
jgi:Ca-activated chloride channel family protein